MSELTEWNSFCVIVGSSAGALIGLQFVVLALIAERPLLRAAEAWHRLEKRLPSQQKPSFTKPINL